MKKKTLIILLIIPFIISLITFVSVTIMSNATLADISDISWNYSVNQGFKIQESGYRLQAKAVYDETLELAPGNNLVWYVKDLDNTPTEYAEIKKEGENYYLYALKEGKCQVVCQNERGTVSKFFTAHIYENGAIIVNPKRQGSLTNIDNETYYGQYDLSYNSLSLDGADKVNATFEVVPQLLDGDSEIFAINETDNVLINNNIITITGHGLAIIRFYTVTEPIISSYYSFNIIEDGYNVYNYNDLLMCTNFSSEGKKVVLQTHLESIQNVYRENSNGKFISTKLEGKENYEIFGNFDFNKQKFSFQNELKELKSTYNIKFIEQANKVLSSSEKVIPNIKVGIDVKKDFYGNGYTINGHGLAYPNHGKIETNGKLTPQKEDYFFGPLPYVTIGALKTNSVVKAYGQDNALLYINGDNIIINDLKIRNTNEINNMYNLLYTGSVIDVGGHNNVIKNSIISNGRTAVRAFSSDGLSIENSILKTTAQFLLHVGSNDINPYSLDKYVEVSHDGVNYSDDMSTLFDIDNPNGANAFISYVLQNNFTDPSQIDKVIKTLNQIQAGLDNTEGFYENDKLLYSDVINLNKVLFSNSGIFSIAFDTLFNGPYLYNGIPSSIHSFLDAFNAILPNQIGGTSHPVKIKMDKNCKFYDWKDIDSVDTSVLIEENISSFIKQMFGKDFELSMEDYFPVKTLLKQQIIENNYSYKNKEIDYVNSKVAWYGGGLNLSTIEFEEEIDIGNELIINLLETIFKESTSDMNTYILLLSKCVNVASGFHPFKFLTNNQVIDIPEEFGKVPQIQDLK